MILQTTCSLLLSEMIVHDIADAVVDHGEYMLDLFSKEPRYLIEHIIISQMINLSIVS